MTEPTNKDTEVLCLSSESGISVAEMERRGITSARERVLKRLKIDRENADRGKAAKRTPREARGKTPRQNAATNQKKQINEMRNVAKRSITGKTLTAKKGFKEQVAEMRKATEEKNI